MPVKVAKSELLTVVTIIFITFSNKILEYSKAKQHVKESGENTKKALQGHLQEIKDNFSKILDNSYGLLSASIDETVTKDLQHLQELEEGLSRDLSKIQELTAKG